MRGFICDHLACDRTLVAYARTVITLLAAGGTMIKVFPKEPPPVSPYGISVG